MVARCRWCAAKKPACVWPRMRRCFISRSSIALTPWPVDFPTLKCSFPARPKAMSHASWWSAGPIWACCSITIKSPKRWSVGSSAAWKWSRCAGATIRWRRRKPWTARGLAQYRQLLMSTQTSVYPGSEAASPQVWRADSFYVLAEWLIRGLGWAWLPRHVVQYPAYQNQMVELDSEWTPPALVVELVWRRDEPLGPAARFLAERFAECLQAID